MLYREKHVAIPLLEKVLKPTFDTISRFDLSSLPKSAGNRRAPPQRQEHKFQQDAVVIPRRPWAAPCAQAGVALCPGEIMKPIPSNREAPSARKLLSVPSVKFPTQAAHATNYSPSTVAVSTQCFSKESLPSPCPTPAPCRLLTRKSLDFATHPTQSTSAQTQSLNSSRM